jgi:hypothetical protein
MVSIGASVGISLPTGAIDPNGADVGTIEGTGSDGGDVTSLDGDGVSFSEGELVLSSFDWFVGEYVA